MVKLKKPFVGILAFVTVLIMMPLGHAAMITMENVFGHEHVFLVAGFLGFVGMATLIAGILSGSELLATLLGLFAGLLVWTGWIEFSFVYFANRLGVEPLVENGEIVTKPEYLLMPSTVGLWAVFMIYYFIGTKTGCRFFLWFQNKLKLTHKIELSSSAKSTAMVTFMEIILILWTFYLLLLFAYDNYFAGDKHPVTWIVAFGSLLWSLILFVELVKINKLAYAIRYAIPTAVIFWNFVEILGRWGLLNEIWIEPAKYKTEMILMTSVFFILIIISALGKKLEPSNKK